MGKIKENRRSKFPAILLAFMMVFTTMPFGIGGGTEKVWAADNAVIEISTAEGFANMKSDGNYKLVDKIEVTQPYSKSFRGTFDGDGHVITLKAKVSSGNAGLFAETSSGADIRNVIVNAEIESSATNYSGTGGLIGKVSGNTTVRNCGVNGSIKNISTSTSAAYVGGLIGYISGNFEISDSFTTCNVENSNGYSSASTGGLVGRTSNYNTLSVSNCYTSGTISAIKGYAGGITGYEQCSNSYKHSYNNCYASGDVSVENFSSNAYGFAYSYASTGFSFENCSLFSFTRL